MQYFLIEITTLQLRSNSVPALGILSLSKAGLSRPLLFRSSY